MNLFYLLLAAAILRSIELSYHHGLLRMFVYVVFAVITVALLLPLVKRFLRETSERFVNGALLSLCAVMVLPSALYQLFAPESGAAEASRGLLVSASIVMVLVIPVTAWLFLGKSARVNAVLFSFFCAVIYVPNEFAKTLAPEGADLSSPSGVLNGISLEFWSGNLINPVLTLLFVYFLLRYLSNLATVPGPPSPAIESQAAPR